MDSKDNSLKPLAQAGQNKSQFGARRSPAARRSPIGSKIGQGIASNLDKNKTDLDNGQPID